MIRLRNGVQGRRELLALSGEELARRCGVTRQTIYNIETERSEPSVGLAIKVAEELGSSVTELFWPEVGE